MNIKKTLNKILLPLNILMGAIGLINLADDIVPAFLTFTEFFSLVLEYYENTRDVMFRPFAAFLGLFDLELLEWYKNYLFMGVFFAGTYFSSSPAILEDPSINKKIQYYIIIGFLMIHIWPIVSAMMALDWTARKMTKTKAESKIFGKWRTNLMWLTFIAILIIFINWIWIRVVAGVENL